MQKVDFNGDGKSDLIFSDGTISYIVWEMNGRNLLNGQSTSVPTNSTDWTVFAKGDFDGDRKTDIYCVHGRLHGKVQCTDAPTSSWLDGGRDRRF
ncbi:MAG: FG-GAP repeat domain-containing protein [Burkholderiaceae bacterium]